MVSGWADRWFGALTSAGIHLLLVLGATLVAVEVLVYPGSGGPDFFCGVQGDPPSISRIERGTDATRGRRPAPEPASPFEALVAERSIPFLFPPDVVVMEEGAIVCGSCLSCCRDVIYVFIPRRMPIRDPLAGYAFRKRSLEENRRGMQRLKCGRCWNGWCLSGRTCKH